MKRIFAQTFVIIVTGFLIAACHSSKQLAAVPTPLNLYKIIPDAKEGKALVGIITPAEIFNDTAFGWYANNLKYFKADSATVQAIRAKKDKIHLVLFMGTWCHDSQQLIPKYFETLKAANFSDSNITIIATDRNKKTIGGLHAAYNLENVPTMIVMQKGKEVGRIVEYGSTTFVDKELGELMSKVD